MEFIDVIEHAMKTSDYWYNDEKMAKRAYADELVGPYNLMSDFCQKYGLPSPGIFNLTSTAKVVREIKFLKMRGVITVERMITLYNMYITQDNESQKLAEGIIKALMDKTK